MLKLTLAALVALHLSSCDLSVGRVSHAEEETTSSAQQESPAPQEIFRRGTPQEKLYCTFAEGENGKYVCIPQNPLPQRASYPLRPSPVFDYDHLGSGKIRARVQGNR